MLTIHKRMAVVLLLLLLGWGVAWYLLVLPNKRAIAQLNSENDQLRDDLRRQHVNQFDPGKLTRYKEELHAHRVGLNQRFRTVYERAVRGSNFGRRVAEYDSLEGADGIILFRNSIDTITYQSAFLKLKTDLAREGITLYEPILGLSEDSSNAQTYQLMAHLWIIEDLARLAKKNGLELTARSNDVYSTFGVALPEPDERGKMPPLPARIQALNVGVYKASADAPLPYMEEYPVRLHVSGSTSQLLKFMQELTASPNFMPLSEFSIMRDDTGKYQNDYVEATLVCSGFLIMSSDIEQYLPMDADSQLHNLPPYQPGT